MGSWRKDLWVVSQNVNERPEKKKTKWHASHGNVELWMALGIDSSMKKKERITGSFTREKGRNPSFLTIRFMRIPCLRARFLIFLARDLIILPIDLIGFENPPRKISRISSIRDALIDEIITRNYRRKRTTLSSLSLVQSYTLAIL